jgi:acyl transferase domain-containing protein
VSEFLKRIAEFSPKRLLLLAAELEERVRSLEARNHAPIAIVGMGCRYPGGVEDAEGFWDLLLEGRDAITEVPGWRWDVERLYDPDPTVKGKVASKWGGFVDNVEMFDPGFFGIAPVEAVSVDPQQRLLLEVTWEALEDAGIVPASLNGSRTGVYVGICNTDYGQMALRLPVEMLDGYGATGGAHAVASGRISYFLGLRGPSVAIDTACSASLVAVHDACRSLRLGETELAIAGGVNLVLTPEVTIGMSRGQLMARDGRCKAFSAKADGYVRSEGCGMVVLKRLEDAERDGDRVLGVIRGTAVNQDGRSSGLTAPNGPSQEDVIRTALKDAGVAAEAVSYVEAHGTGTSLGDTIEMQALGETLGRARKSDARLPVGSVKSNFGHLESAAGIAGLMKVVLALQHRTIPASLHCATPNPAIDWDRHQTRVPVMAEPWQSAHDEPRVGAVSSFGFSGTNSHAVVSEAPRVEAGRGEVGVAEEPVARVIVLSARSENALKSMAARLAKRLRKHPELRLADVAYTLSAGRTAFAHRAALRVSSIELLIDELELLARGDEDCAFVRGVATAGASRTAFLFAGQGGERAGMGLSLLLRSEVFRKAVAEVDAALYEMRLPSIETIWRNERGELGQSAHVQPALFAFQYGLARVWQSWGIEPHVVVGHSMGELVAAALAGVLRVEDAVRLVAARGRLTGELGDPGGMVAVAVSEAQALAVLRRYEGEVSLAAINGATSVVISGRAEAVEQAVREFEGTGVRVKRLNITYGSHSPAMRRVVPAFYEEAVKIQYAAPQLPIVADMTGEMVEDESVFNAGYWSEHLARPVQFLRCLERLEREQCDVCIEMGPRAVLTTFGKEQGDAETRWIASADGREEDFDALQSALAEAFVAGAAIDWKAVYRGESVRKVALPAYPFERERYWIGDLNVDAPRRQRRREASEEIAAGVRLDAAVPTFELQMDAPLPFALDSYRVGAQVVVPPSAYVAWAVSAFRAVSGAAGAGVYVRELKIHAPLRPVAGKTTLQTVLLPGDVVEAATGFRIFARDSEDAEWLLYASGSVAGEAVDVEQNDLLVSGGGFAREEAASMSGEAFYARVAEQGIALGESYRGVRELWLQLRAALGRVHVDAAALGVGLKAEDGMPALLEACFQVVGAASLAEGDTELRMMTGIGELGLPGLVEGELWVEARVERHADGGMEGSLVIRNGEGDRLGWVKGIELRTIGELPSLPEREAGSDGESARATAAWQAEPGESRAMALERAVRKEAARVLGMRRGQLPDAHASMADLGMDSLMAVVLRNRLQAMVGHGLPATFAFEHPSAQEMALALDLLLWSSGVVEDELGTAEHDAIERDEIQI